MEIEKQLPFDICENCDEFILETEQKTLWYGDGGSHLVLTVSCKNEEKCKRLREHLKGHEEE